MVGMRSGICRRVPRPNWMRTGWCRSEDDYMLGYIFGGFFFFWVKKKRWKRKRDKMEERRRIGERIRSMSATGKFESGLHT